MKVLIAEDDRISCKMLEATLRKWDYEVVVTRDGRAALQALQEKDGPRLAFLDWMMPELDGVEVCRQVRRLHNTAPTYILLLTAKDTTEDIVAGLEAGADDYLTKPFKRQELHARLRVGQRMLELQCRLSDRVEELAGALARIKLLQGLLPMCCYCKKIRDDKNYWQKVESYLSLHSDVRFSHGICPDCMDTIVKPELERFAQS